MTFVWLLADQNAKNCAKWSFQGSCQGGYVSVNWTKISAKKNAALLRRKNCFLNTKIKCRVNS